MTLVRRPQSRAEQLALKHARAEAAAADVAQQVPPPFPPPPSARARSRCHVIAQPVPKYRWRNGCVRTLISSM